MINLKQSDFSLDERFRFFHGSVFKLRKLGIELLNKTKDKKITWAITKVEPFNEEEYKNQRKNRKHNRYNNKYNYNRNNMDRNNMDGFENNDFNKRNNHNKDDWDE